MAHDDCPSSRWYSPGRQPSHMLFAPVDMLPAAHGDGVVAPAAHDDPAGQSVQSFFVEASVLPLYVPAGQSKAADAPFSQYEPAMH